MKDHIPTFLVEKEPVKIPKWKKGLPLSFLDRSVVSFSKFIWTTYLGWETTSQSGFLQKIDSRIKIFFLIYFIILVSLIKSLWAQVVLGIFILTLGIFSRLPLWQVYKKIFITGGLFGFLIPLPSALNLFTPGEFLFPLFPLPKFFITSGYPLPEVIGITREGFIDVLRIASRVINSLSITLLVFYTTPFSEMVRGFSFFRIPEAMVMVITLTYKYVFLFAKMIQEMHLARKARFMGGEKGSTMRSWVAGRIVFIFQRSQRRLEEVYRAMLSRGFTGKIKTPSPQPIPIKDRLAGIFLLLMGILFLML